MEQTRSHLWKTSNQTNRQRAKRHARARADAGRSRGAAFAIRRQPAHAAQRQSALLRFLLQFHNALVYILLAAGVATAFVKGPTDALTIFGVVLINAVIGYFQEAKAENAIAALAKTLRTEQRRICEGVTLTLPAEDLVPGDVVFLQAGNKVPADLRLMQIRDLQIAEAVLTGESVAVQKNAARTLPADAVLADRLNMATP